MNKAAWAAGRTISVLALLAMVLAGSCGPAAPERPAGPDSAIEEAEYDPIARGRTHYLRYCASCHGEDGRGGGPVAEALKEAPTDVTRFRADENGTFSVDELIEIIRGSRDVRAHGTREMPVWGNIWGDSDLQTASPEQVETRINELVEFIRSIQQPVESSS